MCLLPPKCALSINQPVSLCASPKEHRVPWGRPTSKQELTTGTILLIKGSGSSSLSSTWPSLCVCICIYIHTWLCLIDIKPRLPKMNHILMDLSDSSAKF